MAEIMTEKGLSLGSGLNWILTVLVASFTSPLIEALGGGDHGSGCLFVACGGFCLMLALFSLFVVKETKGLTEK